MCDQLEIKLVVLLSDSQMSDSMIKFQIGRVDGNFHRDPNSTVD